MKIGINLAQAKPWQGDIKFVNLNELGAWVDGTGKGPGYWIPAIEGYCRPGDYVLTAQGKGKLRADSDDVPLDKQQCTFAGQGEKYTIPIATPTLGRRMLLWKLASDAADPIRDVKLYQDGLDPTQFWHPAFLDSLRGFDTLRTVHFYNIETTTETTWDTADQKLWGWVVSLCNALLADPWLNFPHMADVGYAAGLGTLCRALDPRLRPRIEYSNECWNWAPPWGKHTKYCFDQAAALGIKPQEFYARRAAELQDAFAAAFGRPITRILAGQCEFPGGTIDVSMKYAVANGLRFDAIACAPYIEPFRDTPDWDVVVATWNAGFRDKAGDLVLDACYRNMPRYEGYLQQWRALADANDIAAVAYEWGQGLTGFDGDPVRSAIVGHVQMMPRMETLTIDIGNLIRKYLAGGCYYSATEPWMPMKAPTEFWGIAPTLDAETPKRTALRKLLAREAY